MWNLITEINARKKTLLKKTQLFNNQKIKNFIPFLGVEVFFSKVVIKKVGAHPSY